MHTFVGSTIHVPGFIAADHRLLILFRVMLKDCKRSSGEKLFFLEFVSIVAVLHLNQTR